MPLTQTEIDSLIALRPYQSPLTTAQKNLLSSIYETYRPKNEGDLSLNLPTLLFSMQNIATTHGVTIDPQADSRLKIIDELNGASLRFSPNEKADFEQFLFTQSILLTRTSAFSEIINQVSAISMDNSFPSGMDPVSTCNKAYNICIMTKPVFVCEAERQACLNMIPTQP